MGQLVDGQWVQCAVNADSENGAFKRMPMKFRGAIENKPGARFRPEAGRYHLYASYACPWAHRVLIFRKLKDLEEVIDVSQVHPHMGTDGWTFGRDFEGCTGDRLLGKKFLRDIYLQADAKFTGRVTVPVLWDKKEGTIVCNESAELIRMFNSEFNQLTGNTDDFYPEALQAEIDDLNGRIYEHVNDGVYRAGFATNQAAYDQAVTDLFDMLDELEARLEGKMWLVGDRLTEADLRLFPTLIRFDAVYFGHFKCNLRRLVDYPHLLSFTERIYDLPEVAETVRLDHCKNHYYTSHPSINPTGIVPLGPQSIWDAD